MGGYKASCHRIISHRKAIQRETVGWMDGRSVIRGSGLELMMLVGNMMRVFCFFVFVFLLRWLEIYLFPVCWLGGFILLVQHVCRSSVCES